MRKATFLVSRVRCQPCWHSGKRLMVILQQQTQPEAELLLEIETLVQKINWLEIRQQDASDEYQRLEDNLQQYLQVRRQRLNRHKCRVTKPRFRR